MGVIGTESFKTGFHTWKIRIDMLNGCSMVYFGINDISTNPVYVHVNCFIMLR